MPNNSPSQGLSFKKVDLHVHTTSSNCYFGEGTPDQIVQKALAEGLDAIAITDHNTAQSIDAIKAAAKGKPIIVFPGVEISCAVGKKCVHVIALLDPSASSEDVQAILNILEIGPKQYGKEDSLTSKSVLEVLEVVRKKGAIPILAHANSSSGGLHNIEGQQRISIIQSPYIVAVEATVFDDLEKKEKHRRVIDFLDGTDPSNKRKLAVFLSSDNPQADGSVRYGLEGIGSKYTFFKMENINLQSLNQCFVDADVRIRIGPEIPIHRFPQITKVRVNSGFLAGEEVEFHPGRDFVIPYSLASSC
jgi:PHP family Zn ribbon phosphoesterase